jgi:hypothetical protein
LVEVDIGEGMAKCMDIVVGIIIYSQMLDYANVPFRSPQCHIQGHIVENLTFPFDGKKSKIK